MVSVLRYGTNGNPLDSLSQDLADGHARNRNASRAEQSPIPSRAFAAAGSEPHCALRSWFDCLVRVHFRVCTGSVSRTMSEHADSFHIDIRQRGEYRHHQHPHPLHDPLYSKHCRKWWGRRDLFDSDAPASLRCELIEQLFPRHDQRSLSGRASLLVGYRSTCRGLVRVALLTHLSLSRTSRALAREFGLRTLCRRLRPRGQHRDARRLRPAFFGLHGRDSGR